MTGPFYERDLADAGRGHLISGADIDFIRDEARDEGDPRFFHGARVRYVGPLTERDCDATVEMIDGGRVALRLANGALFLADLKDIR